jgi:hypothetical protein
MKQDRKYFGMTAQQLGILGALAAVVCLLFSVVGVLVLRRGVSGLFSRAPQSTPVMQATSTMIVNPTPETTPTATPIPYDQLIPPDWAQYKTTLIELWLPTGFKTAAPNAVIGVSGNAVVMELALISSSKTYTYKPTVSVSYEPLTANTLEDFIDQKLANIPPEVNLAEHRKVSINSSDAYRILFEGHTNNTVDTNDLLFIFQDGGTVWYVKYSAEIADFYELLATFEQSVKTFRIVR